jgi:hypothetical protein
MSKLETNVDNHHNRARSWRIVLLIGLAINISVTCALVAEESSTATPSVQESAGNSFPTPLSPDLPYDVDVAKVRKLDNEGKIAVAQREFDILAWRAFIALNWPADKDGQPDRSKTIADRWPACMELLALRRFHFSR